MIGNKKIIGICLTKINDRKPADYINKLRIAAAKQNYKLIVFNSVVDFYNNDAYDEGAKSVYGVINYDIIDAFIILEECFYNKDIVKNIITKAKEKNVPVIILDGRAEGCISIVKDYKAAYKAVIEHVIKEHGVTDSYFIAGRKKDDEDSQTRIQCYREVLEENGFKFSEDKVGYGEYWNVPTREVVDKLLENGKKPPQAIICANDFMAFDVCERLEEYGYSVPQDVIVTGFDGVADADYFRPRLTTCKEDINGLAELTTDIVSKIFTENLSDGEFKEAFVPRIAESCGCMDRDKNQYRDVRQMFHKMHEMENHETYMYSWIDKVLESPDVKKMSSMLAKYILPNSYICLKPEFVDAIAESRLQDIENYAPGDMLAVPSVLNRTYKEEKAEKFNVFNMLPDVENWLEDDSVYILSAVFVGSVAGGYYAVSTEDVEESAHQINRLTKTINIAFNTLCNYHRQSLMQKSIDNAALTDVVTGLPNLKGALKWFEKFAAVPQNHEKMIIISVYGMAKYKYIYENYGLQDIEEVLCKVAELLRSANPRDCYIAHVTEENFIVVNYLDKGITPSEVIDRATTAFYGNIEKYNSNNGKEYYVEVNAGCTVANPGWNGKLEGFMKLANNEMYINRLKQGVGAAVKEENKLEDHYRAFNILMEKNLFHYHFQPIVDARTGEIYAYEALMRTDASIGMNPLQVLETAGAYKRLYEIERATMFNVMGRFAEDFEQFAGHKVFINSIPGYVLNETDNKLLSEKFSEYMSYFVFEITEQNVVSDEELQALKNMGNTGQSNEIAIDDYGTGHSNIVNLLRYAPQIIKIDRFLIENIHQDVNKQMFVKSTIDFACMNGIKVLAEGVETADELRTVVSFGVDYVQGYYTGRPAPNPIQAVAGNVKAEILKASPVSNVV